MTRAILRVVFDSMAWLYANQLKLQAKMNDPTTVVTEDQFALWENEWKRETTTLIQEQESDD